MSEMVLSEAAVDKLPTAREETVCITESERVARSSQQWLLEKEDKYGVRIDGQSRLEFLVCAQASFGQIAKDLREAKESVDIVCWGFEPAMELERHGSHDCQVWFDPSLPMPRKPDVWPRGLTYGELLQGLGERGVQVRLVCWYGMIGSTMANNLPGYSRDNDASKAEYLAYRYPDLTAAQREAMLQQWRQRASTQARRRDYNASWYEQAVKKGMKGLSVRMRDGPVWQTTQSVSDWQKEEASKCGITQALGFAEKAGLALVATHHQKTILIDYHYRGGSKAVGYVMGLNSVTDYWDSEQHLADDARRGEGWEGVDRDETLRRLKPLRDYATRVRGQALVPVYRNFAEAWKEGGGVSPPHNGKDIQDADTVPPHLSQGITEGYQRVQVVRTKQGKGEEGRSIYHLYHQAASQATKYIYLETQYFQWPGFFEQIKRNRKVFRERWQQSGGQEGEMPWLNLFLVTPTQEHTQMVPTAYDTARTLGLGESFPNQQKLVEDELKRHAHEQAAWDAYQKRVQASQGAYSAGNLAMSQTEWAPPMPTPLSQNAREYLKIGQTRDIANELKQNGIQALLASLWSYDSHWMDPKPVQPPATSAASPSVARPAQRPIEARYREIYIHSKLMLIDDAMFTLGSANLNLRSMVVDSEINVATDDAALSRQVRDQVWQALVLGNHEAPGNLIDSGDKCNTGGNGSAQDIATTFKRWADIATKNLEKKNVGDPIRGFLVKHRDTRSSRIRVA